MEVRGVQVKVSLALLHYLLGLDASEEITFVQQNDPSWFSIFIKGSDLPVVPEGAEYPLADLVSDGRHTRIELPKEKVFLDDQTNGN